MKKTILCVVLAFYGILVFAQKKENGTIYIEHPAIKVVDEFAKAFVEGNNTKLASYLADDFKWYDGTSSREADKTKFLNTLLPIDKFDYFSLTPYPGSYPDALQYQKDNKDGSVTVITWVMIKGVDKATGVKIDNPGHFQFVVNKDNKIKLMIEYMNSEVFDEIERSSESNRTNGKIYNHHENINTVRKAVYALEKGDIDKSLSYYNENARFFNINTEWENFHGKAEEKTSMQNFLNEFEIKSIDMIGYPDYLEYEMGNGRSVLSWWKLNLVRKSDKKAIALPMHINDGFDENGKIIYEMCYYSESLLTQK